MTTVIAAEPPNVPNAAEIQQLLQKAVDDKVAPGAVLGVIFGDVQRVFVAGKTTPKGDGPVLDGDTIYEIGSITKTYTALLLAEMAERGEVRLDQPVEELVPPGVRVPKRADVPILLEHLATHRSGLPRLPGSMLFALFSTNPYKTYSAKRLFEDLPRARLGTKPGEKVDYSNFGAGLLGEVLSRKIGKPYDAAVKERILDPLGMKDTVVKLSDAHIRRLAPPHDSSLQASHNWDLLALAGAGALRSSVNDQLKYLRAQLTPPAAAPASLRAAIPKTHVKRAAISKEMDMALGWHISHASKTAPSIVWHNGGTGGYHSFAGFNAERRLAVVLLLNAEGMGGDEIAMKAFDSLAGPTK